MSTYPPIELLEDQEGKTVAFHLKRYKDWEENYQPTATYNYSEENLYLLESELDNHNLIWTKYSTPEADEMLEKGLVNYGPPDPTNLSGKFVWQWIVCEVPWGHDTESPLNISPVVPCWSCSQKEEPSEDCQHCAGYGDLIFYFEEDQVAPRLDKEGDEDVTDTDA